MDSERWSRLLARMPEVMEVAGPPLAVAFIGAGDHAAKRGRVWLWWPGKRLIRRGNIMFFVFRNKARLQDAGDEDFLESRGLAFLGACR